MNTYHMRSSVLKVTIFNLKILFIFGCAGSLLLLWLVSTCREQGLLSSCGALVSHGQRLLLWNTGSRVRASVAVTLRLNSYGS